MFRLFSVLLLFILSNIFVAACKPTTSRPEPRQRTTSNLSSDAGGNGNPSDRGPTGGKEASKNPGTNSTLPAPVSPDLGSEKQGQKQESLAQGPSKDGSKGENPENENGEPEEGDDDDDDNDNDRSSRKKKNKEKSLDDLEEALEEINKDLKKRDYDLEITIDDLKSEDGLKNKLEEADVGRFTKFMIYRKLNEFRDLNGIQIDM